MTACAQARVVVLPSMAARARARVSVTASSTPPPRRCRTASCALTASEAQRCTHRCLARGGFAWLQRRG
eukprot:3707052-Alexandrium_andersonii.AAC.1